MATLLAKKSGPIDNAIAKDDDHHELMANDPAIPQIPPGSTFGTTYNGFNTQSSGTPTFGAPTAGGFYSSGSFGAPAPTGYGSTSTGGFMGQPQPQQNVNAGGSNAAQGADVLVANDNSDWINKKWRPVMGWVYMLTCTCDFVLFPILWSILQALTHGNVTTQWTPLTLQGAGLYHIAMGAVLGIAAYGRTKEKVAGAA